MQQQALAVSLVILALVSSLTAFDSSKPFESQLDQEGNYCCLPNVFSYNYSLTVVVASNSSLVVSDGSQFFHADYNLGKIKQSASFSIAGKVYSFTLWDFKVSDSITVEYRVPFEGACSCGKIKVNSDKWTPTCIPKSEKIIKGKIGNYKASRIQAINKYQQNTDYWVFSDEEAPIEDGKCWLLQTSTFSETGTSQSMYFDQTVKVDPNVFKVPSYCPAIEKCLNQ